MEKEEKWLKGNNFFRKMRLQIILVFSFLFCFSNANAQGLNIGGVIVDEFDEPLIGANIKLKGTENVGTITDFDGNFNLSVTGSKDVLIISYLGYKTQEIQVGSKTAFRVKLVPDSQVLEEVVVTAMGIERKAKSLTYATQSVSGTELTRAKESHLASSLQGKMAGLIITPNSSGAGGGSSKITLRGQTSLLGNNDALIVVDGIPISNGASGQVDVGNAAYGSGRDGGDPLSNYNADDIANITVLKGANAAALYGSRANNGVILITTKSGREGAVRVDLSSSSLIETPLLLPKFQNNYGGDITGNSATGYAIDYNSWSKQRMSDYSEAEKSLYSAYLPYFTSKARDNVSDYFGVGMNFNNTISINGGSENAQSYFSYGNTSAKGTIENNTFMRHNLFFKQNFLLFKKYLKLDFSANYINQNTKNTPMSGEARNPLYSLYHVPRNVDMRYFKANYSHKAVTASDMMIGSLLYRRLEGDPVQTWAWTAENANNPYWLRYMNNAESTINRLILNGTANVKIIEGMNAQVRYSRDQRFTKNTEARYASSRFKTKESSFAYSNESQYIETFTDFLLSYNKKVGNIDINASVGGSYNRTESWSTTLSNTADSAGLVNYFDFRGLDEYYRTGTIYENHYGTSVYGRQGWSYNWNAGAYATAQVGFWDRAYVDVSYRQDWSKAFQQFKGSGKTSFGYYSAGANFLLKELFNVRNKKIDMMKLRVSYSEVGNSIPDRYYNSYTYNKVTGTYSGQPLAFDNPKPETTQSFEVGYDMALFNNAFNFDVTYYYSVLSNQYLSQTTVSGQTRPINTGRIRNTGIEITASYNWQINKDWSWKTAANFSFNDNLILSTYDNGAEYSMGWDISGFLIKFRPGGSFGDLYTREFNRDDNGVIKTTSLVSASTDTYAGNAMAKIYYGWNNTFNYKDFSLYILLDGKIGGKVISYTQAKLDSWGVSEATGVDRNGTISLPDGQEVDVQKYYTSVGNVPTTNYVYDATNLRLRELSLGYTFRNLLGNSKNLSLSFVARNLCFLYKDSPVDPDISASTSTGMGGIDVFAQPTNRSYGLNIKVTF